MSHLSSRRRVIPCLLAGLLLGSLTAAGPGQARAAERPKIVEVEVRNLSDRALKDVPLTFGQVFRKGDLPRSTGVYCNIGDAQAQSEVKRRYADGSVRLAWRVPAAGQPESYRVLRGKGDRAWLVKWEPVKTLAGGETSYVDKPGGKALFFYRVVPVTGGNNGPASYPARTAPPSWACRPSSRTQPGNRPASRLRRDRI